MRGRRLLVELKGTEGEVTGLGSGLIMLGVIAIIVGFMLWRGRAFARILIGVIALVRLVGMMWIFASFDRAQWYEGIGSLVIDALVAGYLLFGDTARDHTDSRFVEDLEARLERMEAEAAIVRLKSEYARFADDGVSNGGDLSGRAEGVWAIRRHVAQATDRIPCALHFVRNPIIEVRADGRSATGSWYLWRRCVRRRSIGWCRRGWQAPPQTPTS